MIVKIKLVKSENNFKLLTMLYKGEVESWRDQAVDVRLLNMGCLNRKKLELDF